MSAAIRVLIVDDSALVRQALREVLCDVTGDFSIIASVADPFQAVRALRDEVPDVILLDIEMPKMDGVTFLRKLMRQHPIPTVICSSLARQGATVTLAALEAGAIDIIEKPNVSTRHFFLDARARIQDIVRAAACAKVVRPQRAAPTAARPAPNQLLRTTDRVVVVGASTGGTEAIDVLLSGLDAHCPGIAIVQHMPAGFTASFAKRLDAKSSLHVREAKDGDAIVPGQALLAPGDHHMEIRRSGAHYHVTLSQRPPVNRHRPSVDVLFHSAAEQVGANAVGVILTGMGNDGALGMKAMRDQGASTIAQDEATSIVYGMPNEAFKLGGAEYVRPLEDIARSVIQLCSARSVHPPARASLRPRTSS